MHFFKYQGTGNDFILIDGTKYAVNFSVQEIQKLCDRRFGIGADGIIILKKHKDYDFEMDYYNADGTQSFCGNGSRCAQAFARHLGWIKDHSHFLAIDGAHSGEYRKGLFATKMGDVDNFQEIGEDYFIHTGSPHYIQYVENVDECDVFNRGKKIRNSETYRQNGTNVNFVEITSDGIKVRTYERGVEAETYSCGTGVTAAAISFLLNQDSHQAQVPVVTRGGQLQIELQRNPDDSFNNIWLIGPAELIYEGEIK